MPEDAAPVLSAPVIISHTTLRAIHDHVEHARIKYPWDKSLSGAARYRIVEHEFHEMAAAMLKGDWRGTRQEALDAIAVLVRIVEGDGEEEGVAATEREPDAK